MAGSTAVVLGRSKIVGTPASGLRIRNSDHLFYDYDYDGVVSMNITLKIYKLFYILFPIRAAEMDARHCDRVS